MLVYLDEYINSDVYDRLKKNYTITKNILEAECIISRTKVISNDVLQKCKALKCVAMYGTGVDAIDLVEAKKRNITVFNAPRLNSLSVAELNIMLTLMILRKYNEAHNNIINETLDYQNTLGNELTNKTVGFIGVGKISKLTAKLLYGFDVKMIGYNRSDFDLELIEKHDLDYVLANSDILIMGLALNSDTYHFINENRISKMKDNVYIVNATRGALIDKAALINGLKGGKIKGYASDVFEVEPISKDDPLLQYNVISTAHVGGNTVESLYRVGMTLLDDLDNFKNNKPLKNKVV